MIKEAISKGVAGEDLTRDETAAVMNEVMSGKATDAQIAAFLVALRLKGETVEEIVGSAQVMRQKVTPIRTKQEVIVDTCGTGGDGYGTFNISTVAAFVAAGAGSCVAKHGNRSVSSNCGSADVMESLGINIEIPPERVERCLDEAGIGFLFAPLLHGAMKYAIGPRRQIGIRTIFNVLGPLTNPAGARRQLIGVYDAGLTEVIADVLRSLGSEYAFVVHGNDGLDEITLTGPTRVSELAEGEIRTYQLEPEELGLSKAELKDLLGGSAEDNAEIILSILGGSKGPKRDIVLLNAGVAIVAAGEAETIAEGIGIAAESIDSGRALQKLEQLRRLSNLQTMINLYPQELNTEKH